MFPRPFLIALQFLTRVPVRLDHPPNAQELGRSLLWYPVVGLLLGTLLWTAASALAHAPPPLRAALLLTLWVLTTGALHLDGLADTADAWAGGRGDRERALAIMKDPHVGPVAVVIVALVLLLKFASIEALSNGRGLDVLVLAPLLARTAMPLLFATTPYVRASGIGSALATNLPRQSAHIVGVLVCGAVVFSCGWEGAWAAVVALGMFMLLRSLLMRRLCGMTGDCGGAMIELIETALLIALASTAGEFPLIAAAAI